MGGGGGGDGGDLVAETKHKMLEKQSSSREVMKGALGLVHITCWLRGDGPVD